MKRILPLLILAATCTVHADTEKKPYAVYGPDQSCLYTFVDNEAFVTCDESAAHIASLYNKEKQRILQVEFDGREERKSKEWRERRREERMREIDAEYDRKDAERHQSLVDELIASSPRGWACVQKRLPQGADLLESSDFDAKACAKEFNADAKLKKKKNKTS
jgi:hypothetical protein